MTRRGLLGIALGLIMLLALASPAAAGRWATVELDEPVEQATAGEPLTIGFTLKQHGQTPVDWPTTYFTATHTETGETIRFDARADGEVGHWVVEVTFPKSGAWEWAIQTDELYVQDTFGTVTVSEGAGAAETSGAVSNQQLNAAIEDAQTRLRTEFDKRLSTLALEVDSLQKQVDDLTAERDKLQKQLVELQTAQSAQADGSDGVSWWPAAVAGAVAAIVMMGAGYALAAWRGLIGRRELAPATS